MQNTRWIGDGFHSGLDSATLAKDYGHVHLEDGTDDWAHPDALPPVDVGGRDGPLGHLPLVEDLRDGL